MAAKTNSKVNVDLQKERDKCNFNVEELTNFLDGGVVNTEERRKFELKIINNKELRDDIPEDYLSHKEKYENAIRKAVYYSKTVITDENYLDPYNFEKMRSSFRNIAYHAVFKDNTPFSLHFSMFIPAIIGQGTKEQQEIWLKRALKLQILGTYAQTELGHGTFLRGLETTANYDPKTEEFILHSPTLSSYKWWPGNLGHTANYCITMAQLHINGKHCGVQPFIVQIRDEETHMPLPGIKLGEIGAKLGFNTVNNGFMGFDNHRIPRDRMLMKNSQVLKDGTFIASPNSKLAYGTMVFIRVTIVNSSANLLAKAAMIATRYAAVRRQSKLKQNEPECQIIDFLTQQHKLFIAIATSHAFTLVADWLWGKYTKVTSDLEAGRLDTLPELHMIACGLKAVTSSDSAICVERCRLACGGHGYMLSSNLPTTYGLATAACTYEGENTVMMLQTARSLVKEWRQPPKESSTTWYFKQDPGKAAKWENTSDGVIRGFQQVTAGKLGSCVEQLAKFTKHGVSEEDAWNLTSVQLVAAAEAYTRTTILTMYKEQVEKAEVSGRVRTVLTQLMELYIIYWTLEKLGDLLLYTSIKKSDVEQLQLRYEQLLQRIRPNAVGLVDAFDYPDEVLNSTLGSYDGRVYERLMEEAMKSPLNAEPVNQSFHKYLKPFLQGKL